MPLSNPDDTLLLIRCPSCGQRFKVGEDLRGRTVECGGCEHRFKINDDTIVRGKKFYPGEHSNPSLNQFRRVQAGKEILPGALQPLVAYSPPPNPSTYEPISPQRLISGVAGATAMVLMALLLILGANRNAALDGMPTQNRLMLAGFVSVLGMAALLYANPKNRGRAFVLGGLMVVGLLSLPFVFTAGSNPLSNENVAPIEENKRVEVNPQNTEAAELANLIGTKPLEEEIQLLKEQKSTKHAVGLWLRDLREENRLLIRDYIMRTTGASQDTHYYPRDKGDYLMVVTGIDQSLEEIAKTASVFGTIQKIYSDISVAEIRVNNITFVGNDIQKLTNKDDPDFYTLNNKELDSIDLERVHAAVRRLAQAEPKVYRSDIARKLLSLLDLDAVSFKSDVCSALSVWSEKPGPAGDAALKEVKVLIAKKVTVPREMISLIVKEKNTEGIPILDELWHQKPSDWESLYGDFGPLIELRIIRGLADDDGGQRQSAVRLLGRVGGEDSLPVLKSATAGADSEMRVLIEKATASILSRMGQ